MKMASRSIDRISKKQICTCSTLSDQQKIKQAISEFPWPGLCFKTKVDAQPLIWKSFFLSHANRTHFTRKVVHLASLILKVRVFGTRKWPICTCNTHFCLFLPVVCTTTMPFYTTKTSNFAVAHYFYGGIVVCAYQRFCFQCSCSLYFFTVAHLAGRQNFSFSHRRYEIFMFFFQQNSSPLYSITSSSSFSVIHASVNIKNNVEKDTTLFFFLSL